MRGGPGGGLGPKGCLEPEGVLAFEGDLEGEECPWPQRKDEGELRVHERLEAGGGGR